MAIVANLARPGEAVDKPLTTHNRVTTADPNGALTPQFAGEIVLDTTNQCYWKAMGVVNNTWVALTAPTGA